MSLKNLSLNLAYQFQDNFLCSEVNNEKKEEAKKKFNQSNKKLQDLDDSRNWLANCYEREHNC